MTESARRHSGLLLAVGTAVGVSIIAGALLAEGSGVEGWHRATQLTARFSAFVFLTAFLARPLSRIIASPATVTLLRERRGVGLGFAGAHTVHLAAILIYFAKGGIVPPIFVPILGGIGYALIWAMAATSNDRAVRALGRNWKRLHTVGIYYVWMIFLLTYLGRLKAPHGAAPIYYAMSALFVVALAVRLSARLFAARATAPIRLAETG
jgi:methionine sulfoxide reductase heme-binding subunit